MRVGNWSRVCCLHRAERPGLPVGLDELVAETLGFLAVAEADSTRRNYPTDWRAFTAWVCSHGFESLPADPEVVALYQLTPRRATTRSSTASPCDGGSRYLALGDTDPSNGLSLST